MTIGDFLGKQKMDKFVKNIQKIGGYQSDELDDFLALSADDLDDLCKDCNIRLNWKKKLKKAVSSARKEKNAHTLSEWLKAHRLGSLAARIISMD